MKKALFVATVGRFFGFERNDIKILRSLGYEVHIAANLKLSEHDDFQADGILRHHIDFARVPWSKTNLNAYKQLKALFRENRFDLVHCHTPMGGILGRLAAKKYRKTGTKVFYTAHGFHFFKGAPLMNWLLYYPAEWLFAHWTDILITINQEDFARAQKHMHAKQVVYVPGVGVDLRKFSPVASENGSRAEIRKSLGMGENDKLVLSVGELNANKNHASVIRAIADAGDQRIHYAIAGEGEKRDSLLSLSEGLGIADRVHLLGFRSDMAELYKAADLYVHPSLREGLPVALMEALASGAAVICSNVRGNADLVEGTALFDAKDTAQIGAKISSYLEKDNSSEIGRNSARIQDFSIEKVAARMREIYLSAVE